MKSWLIALLLAIVALDLSASVVSNAAMKAANKAAAKQAVARAAMKPVDIVIRRSQYPTAAVHIEHAQKMGQPTVLTIDRRNSELRRKHSLQYIKRKESSPKGMDRDEYPPAMTLEGGPNSSVHYIPLHDNRGMGKFIERQTKDLPDGARVRILVAD
ncbi:MAG: sporulation protein [Hydrogenophilales bacterium]|nr:sporulation protein [Hydrogenophilales bacterium]